MEEDLFAGLLTDDSDAYGEKILSETDIARIMTGEAEENTGLERSNTSNRSQVALSFKELPFENQVELTQKYYETAYHTASQINILDRTYDYRFSELRVREEIKKRAEEREVERAIEYESEICSCFIGPDRSIWARIERPSKRGRSFVVIDQKGVKLTKLISVAPTGKKVTLFRLKWDLNSEGVVFPEFEYNADGFSRVFRIAGIAVHTSRRNHNMILEKIFDLLLCDIDTLELKYGFGWHMDLKGSWYFAASASKSFREEEERCQKNV